MIDNIIELLKEIANVNKKNPSVIYSKRALESYTHGGPYNMSIQNKINTELKYRDESFRIETYDFHSIKIVRNVNK